MTCAKAIFERLRHAPIWTGAGGVYANLSSYPKVDYYAKCPKCGGVHGDYKSMREAHARKTCDRCSINAVDKIKDWIADAAHPEKPKPGEKFKKFKPISKVLGGK